MDLLEKILCGAVGYGISEVSKSHPVRDVINSRYAVSKHKLTLEDLVEEYARRCEIYTCNNDFAHRLHEIAKKYEEYNYVDVYEQ